MKLSLLLNLGLANSSTDQRDQQESKKTLEGALAIALNI